VAGDTETAKLIANYLTSDLLPHLIAGGVNVSECNHVYFAKLMGMAKDGKINSRVAKDLLKEVVMEGKDPETLATERGLLQSNNDEQLLPIAHEVIESNPSVVLEYKAGKEASLQFLLGQGMKLSKGSANPKVLLELIKKTII
jgi:aspartyl-tRNA(Asn)/glutamyl-tRNA(Gln) amidotransferase subunit B